MEILHVLNSQSKTIEKEILSAGFELSQFTIDQVQSVNSSNIPSKRAGRLRYQNKYYFVFDNVDSRFRSQWSPGKEATKDDEQFKDWGAQLPQFKLWLAYLKRETVDFDGPIPVAEIEGIDPEVIEAVYDPEEANRLVDRAIAGHQTLQTQLRDTVSDFDHLDIDKLRNSVLESGRIRYLPALASLVTYFRDVIKVDLATLSTDELEWLTKWAEDIRGFGKILGKKSELSLKEEDRIRVEADVSFRNNRHTLRDIIAYGKTADFDFEGNQAQGVEFLKAIGESKREVDDLVKRLKEESQKVTVANEAKYFANEARSHNQLSWLWLALTGALAGYSFYFAQQNYNLIVANIEKGVDLLSLSNYQSAQFVVSKIVIFSFLIGGVFWMGRVYKAHRHNYVVNRHRANALNCFNVFVESTTDDQIKNAVLMHAAQCIFTPQTSGYINQENEGLGVPQIVEIVKDISKTSK